MTGCLYAPQVEYLWVEQLSVSLLDLDQLV